MTRGHDFTVSLYCTFYGIITIPVYLKRNLVPYLFVTYTTHSYEYLRRFASESGLKAYGTR